MSNASKEVDYIVVGAGSAGCVLANRLTESGAASVLLIEAGGRDINPFIHMPAGIAKLIDNPRIDWNYYTEPESELAGRKLYWPRGKVLGGSSSINAMCYIRGAAGDYDEWRDAGLVGWGFDDVLPYFRKSEDQARGPSGYHGAGGPLSVEDLRFRNPLSGVFVDAALAAGWSRSEDFNGASQQGFGFYQVTQRAGRRCSTAVAYLRPALPRPNLRVLRKATVLRVLLEHGRAVGVEYVSQGRRAIVRAAREVLLSAGAIGSPQVLLLSGIGPPQDLQAAGVPAQVALPGVGRNLQDHLDFCTLYKCTRSITYDFGMWREAAVGLRYLLTGSGPGVSNVAEAGGFARTRFATDARADLQFHFVPAQLDDHGRNRLPGHGFTVHACVLRPASRGHVSLRSASAFDPPRIFAGYLSAGEDLAHLIEGVRIAREIVAAGPFDGYRGAEIFPGPAAVSDEQLREVVRLKAESIYHPVGTCRMGIDEQAVVDANLCVRGVAGLRVVDASIMPRIIGGNTNAPTVMIAEKAADLIHKSR